MSKPSSKSASNSRAGTLTIAAGPIYIEFRTQMTFAPSSDTHTELTPRDGKWKPEIGGSAWKMALHCKNVHGKKMQARSDKFILISRFAQENKDTKTTSPNHPFGQDDARWLRESLRKAVGDTTQSMRIRSEPLDVIIKDAKGLTDYTFHMEHPIWRPWPVLTIQGGAASELVWQDVIEAWEETRDNQRRYKQTMIFLTGVLRTSLLGTLAEAIHRKDQRTIGQGGLLNHAKLVIDFGRTARNIHQKTSPDPRQEESDPFRNIVRTCVKHADVVLADEPTAEQFGLRLSENLPKGRLVIRRGRTESKAESQQTRKPSKDQPQPQTRSEEIWWQQYRKADPNDKARAQAFSGQFRASLNSKDHPGKLPNGEPVADNRPIRDFAIAKSLCLGERTYIPENWQRYVPFWRPETAEDITKNLDFQNELKELECLVKLEAISTLFLCGETGTGKEVVSQWIRDIHPTFSKGKFHAVSCGRERGELVQSELFGHVHGAYTGAIGDRDGAFVTANGGVLLLDDLDALDEITQAMLLRVIEDGLVQPVGRDWERPVELFLIVTTNVHPKELLERKRRKDSLGNGATAGLREDLYYRLLRTGEVLYVPPLRERPEDILPSAKKLWEEQNQKFDQSFPFPSALETALDSSDLIGNFRTLGAAVAKTFRTTLARKANLQPKTQKLPKLVKEWLEESVKDRTRQVAKSQKPAQKSQLLNWLGANLANLQNQEEALAKRVENFRDLWEQAQGQDDQNVIEAELRLGQIESCVASKSESELRKALKETGIVSGTGRGAKWRLNGKPTGTVQTHPR